MTSGTKAQTDGLEVPVLLSYDLGATGDYEGLYRWLDDHEAKECGSSVALFNYEYNKEMSEDDVISSLRDQLSNSVSLKTTSRVYAVCFFRGKTRGRFIVGRRKSAPWEGFGSIEEETVDELIDIA